MDGFKPSQSAARQVYRIATQWQRESLHVRSTRTQPGRQPKNFRRTENWNVSSFTNNTRPYACMTAMTLIDGTAVFD
jgi:hypothetical protein